MGKSLRIMRIYSDSTVDGEGFRDVVFVNMCCHHCEKCHNPESWDYNRGIEVPVENVFKTLKANKVSDVTCSGGEPFLQCESLIELAKLIKTQTKKTIWIYSGFTFEELIVDPVKYELLKHCDVLVDGKFDYTQADEQLLFRGSRNQRVIDINKSLIHGMAITYVPAAEQKGWV